MYVPWSSQRLHGRVLVHFARRRYLQWLAESSLIVFVLSARLLAVCQRLLPLAGFPDASNRSLGRFSLSVIRRAVLSAFAVPCVCMALSVVISEGPTYTLQCLCVFECACVCECFVRVCVCVCVCVRARAVQGHNTVINVFFGIFSFLGGSGLRSRPTSCATTSGRIWVAMIDALVEVEAHSLGRPLPPIASNTWVFGRVVFGTCGFGRVVF